MHENKIRNIRLIGICPVCFEHKDNSGHWKGNDVDLQKKAKEFAKTDEDEDSEFYREICINCEARQGAIK